jgi:cytoskeletal protein CcmA (bactofilin family)
MAGVNSPWEGDYSIPQGPATVPLGPLYITGNLNVQKDNTIVLTGTVYVEGSIDMDKDSELTGDGSIIAVGDIKLAKVSSYGTLGDSTIMSLTGEIYFKKVIDMQALIYAPNGLITIKKGSNVYGAVIGADVNIDKEATIEYDEDIGDRTDLPFSGAGRLKVETWQIL